MFHKLRVSKTIYASDGYVSLFCQGFCYLAQLKYFLGEPLSAVFRKFPGSENFMDKRAGFQYFQSEIFCLTVSKNFVWEPFCAMFQKTSGSEKDHDEMGRVKILPGNLTVSECPKFS